MQDRLIKIDALESCVEMFECYKDFEKQINEIFDSIESLEQQNTALQQERANMQTTHRNTIAKLEARIKELEEPKTCEGCKHLFEHTMQCMNEMGCERILSLGIYADYYTKKDTQ